MGRKKVSGLTENELEVMKIIWESPISLTIQEIVGKIAEKDPSITSAAVIQRMKGLDKKGFIQVDGIKLVSRVYARTYRSLVDKEDYVEAELGHLKMLLSSNELSGTLGLVDLLLGGKPREKWNRQDLESLKDYLQRSKDQLN